MDQPTTAVDVDTRMLVRAAALGVGLAACFALLAAWWTPGPDCTDGLACATTGMAALAALVPVAVVVGVVAARAWRRLGCGPSAGWGSVLAALCVVHAFAGAGVVLLMAGGAAIGAAAAVSVARSSGA
jgi:cytochrome bd-type quinol oxidase subunit 2